MIKEMSRKKFSLSSSSKEMLLDTICDSSGLSCPTVVMDPRCWLDTWFEWILSSQ